MADIKEFKQYVRTPTPIAASVKELGQRDAVSLEVLAALKPDLIIDTKNIAPRAQFSKIAPTLVFGSVTHEGRHRLPEHAARLRANRQGHRPQCPGASWVVLP